MTKQERAAYKKLYNRDYRKKHGEALNQKQRDHYSDNRESMREQQRAYRESNKEVIAEWKRNAYIAAKDKPVFKYRKQAANAKKRGVEFNLTFDEWWDLWADHWEERGKGSDQYCMCRTNDEGAYEVGNVRIDTCRNNILESNAIRRSKA